MNEPLKLRKRFGQHFLMDEGIIAQIASVINPKATQHLVEIGPGQGALTDHLISQVARLDLIEIDHDLVIYLRKKYAGYDHVFIHQADALTVDWASLVVKEKLRVVGNLPYYISTPLLFKLFAQIEVIEDLHFMMQKEVVQRLCARVGDSEYSRLSVIAQFYCDNHEMLTIGPEAFHPPPKVFSSFLRMKVHPQQTIPVENMQLFTQVIKEAFNQRRKTLANSLKKMLSADELKQLGIDPNKRPQQISLENYAKISNMLSLRTQGKEVM